eukprot:11032511-Karenia_brevis.AAC.1
MENQNTKQGRRERKEGEIDSVTERHTNSCRGQTSTSNSLIGQPALAMIGKNLTGQTGALCPL